MMTKQLRQYQNSNSSWHWQKWYQSTGGKQQKQQSYQ